MSADRGLAFAVRQIHKGKHDNLADLEVERIYTQYFSFLLHLSWQIAKGDQVQVKFPVLPPIFLVLLRTWLSRHGSGGLMLD